MDSIEFRAILVNAVSGKNEDIEKLLKFYFKFIKRCSRINGRLDEDLRQHILMHIVKNISKFDLSYK